MDGERLKVPVLCTPGMMARRMKEKKWERELMRSSNMMNGYTGPQPTWVQGRDEESLMKMAT